MTYGNNVSGQFKFEDDNFRSKTKVKVTVTDDASQHDEKNLLKIQMVILTFKVNPID